jgi:hypothetical protein
MLSSILIYHKIITPKVSLYPQICGGIQRNNLIPDLDKGNNSSMQKLQFSNIINALKGVKMKDF